MRCRSGSSRPRQVEQALELLGHLAPRQRARALAVVDLGLVLARGRVRPSRARSMARLRAIATIQVIGVASVGSNWPAVLPDLQVGLLHDLVGEVVPPQDTQHDAVELGARGRVKPLERARVALGDSRTASRVIIGVTSLATGWPLPHRPSRTDYGRAAPGLRRDGMTTTAPGTKMAASQAVQWPQPARSRARSWGNAVADESGTRAQARRGRCASGRCRRARPARARFSASRSRIWSRSSSSSTFFSSSNASPSAALASSSWPLQLVGRALEVVAPLRSRPWRRSDRRNGRIMDAGAVLLGLDLAFEVGRHAVELGDHALDLRNPAPLLVDLKFLQANERLTRLHRLVLPRSPIRDRTGRRHAPDPTGSRRGPSHRGCGSTTLVFGFRRPQDLLKPLISFGKTGCFFLTLAEEGLERLVQADRLVDLGARARPVGAEPDQFLHVGIGRHHLPGARRRPAGRPDRRRAAWCARPTSAR